MIKKMEKVIEIKGVNNGPVNMIVVGTHGNEVCGVEAMNEILPDLKIENGTVYIAYGNPRAIDKNVRYTEKNLNRMYRPSSEMTQDELDSYEYNRAEYLKEYLNKSEHVLDVHASTNSNSKPFIICERNAESVTSVLPFNTVVYGFDENEPGGTDYYMNLIGRVGICVECGYLGDPASTETAKESILSFLKILGHISGEPATKNLKQNKIQVYQKYYSKTESFKLGKKFSDFEIVKAGDVVGVDGEEEVVCDRESIILFAHDSEKVGSECFLLGEYL